MDNFGTFLAFTEDILGSNGSRLSQFFASTVNARRLLLIWVVPVLVNHSP
ncbi:MAG: hypothetical protein KME40_00755 [Komarekiella atlantica HA4396-MV6]|nr:hypothetical protein [Komarekiella atlantica HA4396-MV6]